MISLKPRKIDDGIYKVPLQFRDSMNLKAIGKNLTIQIKVLPPFDILDVRCSNGGVGTQCIPYISEITNRGEASIKFPIGLDTTILKKDRNVQDTLHIQISP